MSKNIKIEWYKIVFIYDIKLQKLKLSENMIASYYMLHNIVMYFKILSDELSYDLANLLMYFVFNNFKS